MAVAGVMRTQVGIVGAGPSGLLLSQLLHLQGIESVVLEHRSQDYVLSRIRAGVLEQGTVTMLEKAGVGARMRREGLPHEGIEIAFKGQRHRVNFQSLVGSSVMIYGQTEVTRDLMDARAAAGGKVLYEAEAIRIEDIDTDKPRIRYRHEGRRRYSTAISSPVAMAITASAAAVLRQARSRPMSVSIPSAGWAFYRAPYRCRMS